MAVLTLNGRRYEIHDKILNLKVEAEKIYRNGQKFSDPAVLMATTLGAQPQVFSQGPVAAWRTRSGGLGSSLSCISCGDAFSGRSRAWVGKLISSPARVEPL
jgi:hypothetical protein